jgi:hypothetical protein
VNKLRKFGAWLWLNKERMLLGVLVGFLCYRVYVIMDDVEIEMNIQIVPPRASGNVGLDDAIPPIAPTAPPGAPLTSLATRNPFLYRPGAAINSDGEMEIDITLVDAPKVDRNGDLKARIKPRKGRTKFYTEGKTVRKWIIKEIREDSVLIEHEDTREKRVLGVSER